MLIKDNYFMEICDAVAKCATCKSRKVGSIAVRDGRILATGYNGPPRKYPHCITCKRREMGFESGHGLEFCPAEHAERNVVNNAAANGVSLEGATLYMTGCQMSCRECTKAVINAGIVEIVSEDLLPYPEPGLTGLDIAARCGIKLRKVDK